MLLIIRIMLLLAVARVVAVKATDYQEHTSEFIFLFLSNLEYTNVHAYTHKFNLQSL